MKLTEIQKLLASVAFVHLAAIIGVTIWWEPLWFFLSFFAHLAFLWLGHDLYHHRYLSHRSFAMPVWMQRLCAVLGVYCLFGTPIGIAATHAQHHRYADSDKDPHPAHHPIQAWFWTYPAIQSRDRKTVIRISKDEWLRIIGRHYFAIYLGTIVLALAIDPRIAIYGFFVPAVYGFFSNDLVNVVCHRWGYRRYQTADSARNNLVVNALLFFGGIALHNTHHAKPKEYQLSRAWYEVDLVGCIAHLIHTKTTKVL